MTPKQHLLTFYTRTPLHVGSGSSVDVVDLPIMRERITGFPVIPASSLKGVLLQHAREIFENGAHARLGTKPEDARLLFGDLEDVEVDGEKKQKSWAGCVQIMEAKILAFPVRSLAGCFAWLTCPSVLRRFHRDTGKLSEIKDEKIVALPIPNPAPTDRDPFKDYVIAGTNLHVPGQNIAVFEEYSLERNNAESTALAAIAAKLAGLCDDGIWTGGVFTRLAIVSDDTFQHFVTTCTEVVTRIAINPQTRTVQQNDGGGALFNQENVPCETLFYSVLTVLPPRRDSDAGTPERALAAANEKLETLLPNGTPPILQIGGDETTGHGQCQTKRIALP